MSIAVFASRILGLVREQVFANLFGAGLANDAFVVAFRIPNLLRDLFAEGALSSAFVTVFTDYDQKEGLVRTWRLANNVIMCSSLLVGSMVLLGMIFSPELVNLMAPDFGLVPGKLGLTTLMTRIMFPFLLLVSLAAVAAFTRLLASCEASWPRFMRAVASLAPSDFARPQQEELDEVIDRLAGRGCPRGTS